MACVGAACTRCTEKKKNIQAKTNTHKIKIKSHQNIDTKECPIHCSEHPFVFQTLILSLIMCILSSDEQCTQLIRWQEKRLNKEIKMQGYFCVWERFRNKKLFIHGYN